MASLSCQVFYIVRKCPAYDNCVVFDLAQNHYVFQLAPREVVPTPVLRRRAADLVEILTQPDMISVMRESSMTAVDVAATEPTPPFDGKIQATPQEVATPADVPTSRVFEAPEFIEPISQHIAIGTSGSNFSPRASYLFVPRRQQCSLSAGGIRAYALTPQCPSAAVDQCPWRNYRRN